MTWQQIRLQVMERDRYECQKCGLNFPEFDVHHIKVVEEPDGSVNTYNSFDNLVTLCRSCHMLVEGARRRIRNRMHSRLLVDYWEREHKQE